MQDSHHNLPERKMKFWITCFFLNFKTKGLQIFHQVWKWTEIWEVGNKTFAIFAWKIIKIVANFLSVDLFNCVSFTLSSKIEYKR